MGGLIKIGLHFDRLHCIAIIDLRRVIANVRNHRSRCVAGHPFSALGIFLSNASKSGSRFSSPPSPPPPRLLAIWLTRSLPRQLFHLLGGGHSPACRSFIRHAQLAPRDCIALRVHRLPGSRCCRLERRVFLFGLACLISTAFQY